MDHHPDHGEHRIFLENIFFHGTARADHAFRPGRVAYLTPDERLAPGYAAEDAGIDGGEPILVRAKLLVSNPVVIADMDMQDLHFRHDLVAEYRSRGHDCALGHGSRLEIAVFDGATGIEI